MDVKEVGEAMQEIEFVLFQMWSNSTLHAGEVEAAHKKAKAIMQQYLLPLGAFKTE